jgi:molybdopterin/thiamine biosynthesis adenylyltransferase
MKRVVIVGVGALGSHVAMLLRNTDAKLHVIDDDRVEQRNIASQFHGQPGVGKLKVQALQQSLDFLFRLRVDSTSTRLRADNTEQLLSGAALVIDCVDNGSTRRLIQEYVRRRDIPCLHGALAANGEFGRAIWDEHFAIDDEASGAATCENGDFLPFIAITAARIAQSAAQFLRTGSRIGFQISPIGTIAI